MSEKELQQENDDLRAIIQEYRRKWNSLTEVNKRLIELEDYKADAELDKKTELDERKDI